MGGVLTQEVGWPWIFYVNVPIGALVIVGSLSVLARRPGEKARGFDVEEAGDCASAKTQLRAFVPDVAHFVDGKISLTPTGDIVQLA